MDWLIELLMPWRRLQRIERELDRAERAAVARMQHELWRAQREVALRRFHEPMFFKRFVS
ncbi:MAG: hypothetical protein OEW90_01865 [Betaproteobacteria bacterium]|nr:hypothetical protein [Betaproteobacteria bacterium]MDH4322866.1 hypothetical protein [Betaproteobacteria bacterium]